VVNDSPKVAIAKTFSVLLLFIALKAVGNLSLAWGMKHLMGGAATSAASASPSVNPLFYIRAMLNPYVLIGVVALIVALLARMVLLSISDLSFVLPVTAVGYVIATYLGKTVLHEEVTAKRWIGTVLIVIGAVLTSSTVHTSSARTSSNKEAKPQ
jgi:drug/metabolite transporter (DMT)-like permease